MSRLPAQLSKRCDICGGIITNASIGTALANPGMPVPVGLYMCGSCNTVYDQYGRRDLRYLNIYEVQQRPVPANAAFNALHQGLVGTPRLPPVHTPEQRLALVSLTVGAPVQVNIPGAGWLMASARDYNTFDGSVVAVVPGQLPATFRRGGWRDAMQPLPAPVLAPPSPAKASRGKRKAAKSAAVPVAPVPVMPQAPVPATHKVWTYDGTGAAVAVHIVPTSELTLTVRKAGKNVNLNLVLFTSPRSGLIHAFHRDTGAQLGVSRSRDELLDKLSDDFQATDMRKLNRDLAAVAHVRDSAPLMSEAAFFGMPFAG